MHITDVLEAVIKRGNYSVRAIEYSGRLGGIDSRENLSVVEYYTKRYEYTY